MNYEKRKSIGKLTTDELKQLFGDKVELHSFGRESVVAEKSKLGQFLCILENNFNNETAMMIEYLPDYMVFFNGKVFFLESKVSTTPCWAGTRIAEANERATSRIDASNCGELAREAHLAYKKYYPESVLLYACNYNKNTLLAQYINKVECVRCDSCERDSENAYDCTACPIKRKSFFESVKKRVTNGSGTPNTNINLDSFVPAKEFFEQEFGLIINEMAMRRIENKLYEEGLLFGAACEEAIMNKDSNSGSSKEESSRLISYTKKIIGQIWKAGAPRIKCPICGGELEERENGDTKEKFLGCSNFPKDKGNCRYTVSLPARIE